MICSMRSRSAVLNANIRSSRRTPKDQYGSFVANGSVYPVTEAAKATADTTTVYSTAGTSNYIYIINNGTQNLTGNNTITPTDRYVLDEMHVVFYDAGKAVKCGEVLAQ